MKTAHRYYPHCEPSHVRTNLPPDDAPKSLWSPSCAVSRNHQSWPSAPCGAGSDNCHPPPKVAS